MKRIVNIMIMLALALGASAQAIQSINERNMKFENRDKRDPVTVKEKPYIDNTIPVDTNTLYFALVDSAQNSIAAEQWRKAEGFLLKAINTEPGNPNNSLLLSNIATIQRRQGRLDEAIRNYSMAIDLTPNAVALLLNRAAAYTEIDSLSLAQADYERIMMLDASDVESRYNHGILALNMGDAETASKDFEDILSINPNSGLAKQGQGFVHKHAGEYEKAAQCFGEVIKVKPSSTLLANRADCYLATKNLNDASVDIANALELDPDDPYIYILRAKLNKLRFNRTDMDRDIKLAIAHGISEKEARALLGE
ncbi:MAG: tetratricopeptide repeat protein [Muribaculaceae bacterium]|nr:tetratricopeptide repeat protein [Muribaculaceae bacterium]